MRYPLRRTKSGGFAPTKEIDFAVGAAGDPYGFKPTDIVVDYDGSLLISDWCDGQRPKRGRGRIYRISHQSKPTTPPSALVMSLDSESYHSRLGVQLLLNQRCDKVVPELRTAVANKSFGYRGRMHAVWLLANCLGAEAVDDLFKLAETDKDPRVQAQAVRAIADLTDPILVKHRLDAGRGSSEVAERLTKLASNADPRIKLEVIVALGRLRWKESPRWLKQNLKSNDLALIHAAQQTLRRADNWPEVLKLLDLPVAEASSRSPSDAKLQLEATATLRTLALQAIADQPNEIIVDGLIQRLSQERKTQRRREYIDALARVYKKPAEWIYWGFRPKPRTANSVEWSGTTAIEQSLHRSLADEDLAVRGVAVQRMLREEIPVPAEALAKWLAEENDANRVAVILQALKDHLPAEAPALLEKVIRDPSRGEQNRMTALTTFIALLKPDEGSQLLPLTKGLPDDSVLAKLIEELGHHKVNSTNLLFRKTKSANAEVRAAAISSLARRDVNAAGGRVFLLLKEQDVTVLRSAAAAAGTLQVSKAKDRLLELTRHSNPSVRAASLTSLRQLKNPDAVDRAVDALNHSQTQLAALKYLQEFGGPEHAQAIASVARSSHSRENVFTAITSLARWDANLDKRSKQHAMIQSAIGEIHGATGVLMSWHTRGPIPSTNVDEIGKQVFEAEIDIDWQTHLATDDVTKLRFPAINGQQPSSYLATCDVVIPQESNVEFVAAGNGALRIWLNGKSIFRRDKPASSRANSNSFEATLSAGKNRLFVAASSPKAVEFSLRFRHKSSKADHERLTSLALQGNGDVARGRELFFNAEKSQCIKCHRIRDQGGRIGPDLAGIGRRFSRIHIVESILQPSRNMAPSYYTTSVLLDNGKTINGVIQQETDTTLKIGDNEGKIHEIPKGEIERRRQQNKSTMPEGLEKKLTDREFVDLIAFLLFQKK